MCALDPFLFSCLDNGCLIYMSVLRQSECWFHIVFIQYINYKCRAADGRKNVLIGVRKVSR